MSFKEAQFYGLDHGSVCFVPEFVLAKDVAHEVILCVQGRFYPAVSVEYANECKRKVINSTIRMLKEAGQRIFHVWSLIDLLIIR